MNFLKGLGFFILILFPMVCFHELGHYLVGKVLGLDPVAFSFGFGPEVLSFFAFETTWKISLLPLGGYVEFPETARNYSTAWAITCLVGPLFNFIYAYLFLAYVNFRFQGDLLTMKGTKGELEGHYLIFRPSKFFTGPTRILFRYTKNGKTFHRPVNDGISITDPKNLSENLFSKIFLFKRTRAEKYLRGRATKNPSIGAFSRNGFLGPIGITQYGAWAYKHSPAFFMATCASFSVSLGVLNLLPLSVFDGGQALMTLLDINFQRGLSTGEAFYVIISAILVLILIILSLGVDIWSLLRSPFKKQEKKL